MDAEPRITVNDVPLTDAQAATVRIALEVFAVELQGDMRLGLGLGSGDELRTIARLYQQRVDEVRKLIFRRQG